MSATAKEATSSPVAPLVPVGELAFVKVRLPLLQANTADRSLPDQARSRDRTVSVILKWQILANRLLTLRSQTMTALEAIEGKGGAVTLKVVDHPKFDALQGAIRDHQEQIAALEAAIRELDGLNAGWLSDLINSRNSLAATEPHQRGVLAQWAQATIAKNAHLRLPIEELLDRDEIYQHHKRSCEGQIARAKIALEKIIPEIEKIEDVLQSVGC